MLTLCYVLFSLQSSFMLCLCFVPVQLFRWICACLQVDDAFLNAEYTLRALLRNAILLSSTSSRDPPFLLALTLMMPASD